MKCEWSNGKEISVLKISRTKQTNKQQKRKHKKTLTNLYKNVQVINRSKGTEHYLNGKSFNRQTLIYMHIHYNMRNQKKIASESVFEPPTKFL